MLGGLGQQGYPEHVTERLIEVDDEKLAVVAGLLGTENPDATVDAALEEVLALDRRRRALVLEHEVDLEAVIEARAPRPVTTDDL
jgi:Arc/MetJ family transcription regulator